MVVIVILIAVLGVGGMTYRAATDYKIEQVESQAPKKPATLDDVSKPGSVRSPPSSGANTD